MKTRSSSNNLHLQSLHGKERRGELQEGEGAMKAESEFSDTCLMFAPELRVKSRENSLEKENIL